MDQRTRPPDKPPVQQAGLPPQAAPARLGALRSVDLMGSAQSVEIEHNGHVYRLQTTKAGKLILTK